jgi:hypothetical protein
MAERTKRIEKGIESLKVEIEEHFEKLEKDINDGNQYLGRYHARELDNSLIDALEKKLKLLGVQDDSVVWYRKKLDELRKKLEEDTKP